MLRSLLTRADDDPQVARLRRCGRRRRVPVPYAPTCWRRYSFATRRTPVIIVASNNRAARSLAAKLERELTAHRSLLPSRSGFHLRVRTWRPAHLSGLACALDALMESSDGRRQVVVRGAIGTVPERFPTQPCGPRFRAETGDLLDLDETAMDLVAAGYERVDQSSRGGSAVRRSLLDVFRPPRPGPSASTCSAMRSSRCAGSRPSPSARWATPTTSRSSRPPSWPSARTRPRSRRSRRKSVRHRRLLPVDQFPSVPRPRAARGDHRDHQGRKTCDSRRWPTTGRT